MLCLHKTYVAFGLVLSGLVYVLDTHLKRCVHVYSDWSQLEGDCTIMVVGWLHYSQESAQQPMTLSRKGTPPHLPSPTLALCSTLNDTRQIEKLDLGIVVVDDTRDACKGGELISSCLRLGAGKLVQKRRLSHRWEACKGKESTDSQQC